MPGCPYFSGDLKDRFHCTCILRDQKASQRQILEKAGYPRYLQITFFSEFNFWKFNSSFNFLTQYPMGVKNSKR